MKNYASFGFELFHIIRLIKDKDLRYSLDDETSLRLTKKIIEMIKDNYNTEDYLKEYNDKLTKWFEFYEKRIKDETTK